MNPETISRIIKLIDQTGDKVVMMDPATERAIVIMDLADYEELRAGQNSGSASLDDPSPSRPEPFVAKESEPVQPLLSSINESPISQDQSPTAPLERPQSVAEDSPMETVVAQESTKVEIELPSDSRKKPSIYANPGQRDPLAESAFSDLTQADLLDKINRDIAAWKTAQDRKRVDQLKSAVSQNRSPETADALEEEERFYLEPID